jgi:hypothetical protein
MKNPVKSFFFLCGVVLALAAFPVFGQQDEIVIDKKPLKDLAVSVKAKNLDWTKPFLVEAEMVLTKDGKFDREKTKFTREQGDAEMVEIVKQAIEATGESGWLGYLRMQGIDNFKLSASQTAEVFSVLMISEQPTPERAKTCSSGFNGLIQMALMLDKNGTKKLGDDEKKLLSGTKVTAKEKSVTIDISIPAQDFQEMMRRKFNESKETTAK